MNPPTLPLPELATTVREVLAGTRPAASVSEAHGSAAALFLTALAAAAERTCLVVTARDSDAQDLELDLQCLAPDLEVERLPDLLVADPDQPETRQNRSQRERALAAMRRGNGWLVASLAALAAPTGDPQLARSAERVLRPGDRVDCDELRHHLFDCGLDPVPLVCHPGEQSFRGDIIDFFPLGTTAPVRIELFDDEVESIRLFDAGTQLSIEKLDAARLPVTRRAELRQGGARFHALDHLGEDALVLRIDPVGLEIAVQDTSIASSEQSMRRQVALQLAARPRLDLFLEFHEGADQVLGARSIEGSGGLDQLGRWTASLAKEVRALHLFSATAAEGKRMTRLLREHLPRSPRRRVIDERGNLRSGFVLPSLGVWVGNHHELLSRTRLQRTSTAPPPPTRPIVEALELSPGDFVVHQTHGVGLYRGMQEHSHSEGTEDYLILEFEGATLLYVPSSKIELLSRYIGVGGSPPRLDRIGGKSWASKKAKVEAALDEISDELIELQARRQLRAGHAFDADDELQAEFDASFPYADTADQVTAVEAIKRDMEAARVMDRLLCGDVGFGKTEVAIRTAFKCASQGKQVTILAPTTLLVRQHVETFRGRMAPYPLRVEALSRLTPPKKSQEVLEGLADGRVDVVIGTHRLLSGKIRYRDLGLLIIDEEHRFGVRHKEALKKLKVDVDVLTLSATPIPRTLHMALVGLRDISTLRQAPRGRQPVDTVVTYANDDLLRGAIERELAREGQVFYLFNRVAPIDQIAARVRSLVPHARVGVAHGQMAARSLEAVTQKFADGDLDVLVCTTIIESGLDLPRVNTLLVERCDLMGLADLHQLRGRVGRSDRKAYAYFLIPRKPLPAVARKRLRALEGLSHLGAGFDVAIRDLEIRGAGNLLGREQSGHIATVGYELFCQMLARAVAKRRGTQPPPEREEIDVGLGLAAFLPREYIHSTHQRMGLMRRLGEARDPGDVAQLADEIRDRFGRLPQPARNLLDLFRLRECCRRHGVSRVFYPGTGEVLLNVRNIRKFSRAPQGSMDARWVEGSRVVLVLPASVHEPRQVLDYLLEQWEGRPTGSGQQRKRRAR